MTGIIIDKFKDKVHVFSDGMVTSSGIIIERHKEKSIKLNNKIYTSAGKLSLNKEFIDAVIAGLEITPKTLKTIHDEGDYSLLLEVSKDSILEHWVDGNKDSNTIYVETCEYSTNVAHFYGSGGITLQGAYKALNPRKAHTEEEYIKLIIKIFEIGADTVNSMGVLYKHDVLC